MFFGSPTSLATAFSALCLTLLLWAPAAEGQVSYAPPDLSGDAPEPESQGQRRLEEFAIGVPLFYDVPRDIVRPGVDFGGRIGLDWGYFGAFIDAGVALIPIDLNALRPGLGKDPLVRLHGGLGVRLQYPTKYVRPYADLVLDFNGWSFRSIEFDCVGVLPGGFWCTGTGAFEFSPGWSGRAGVHIKVKGHWSIDVGSAFSMSYRGNLFSRPQFWLEPYLGFTIRH